MAPFNAHEGGEFVLPVRAFNIVYAVSHRHLKGVAGYLLVDGIDKVDSVAGIVGGRGGLRIGPDGEKLSAEISGLHLFQTDMTRVSRVGIPHIVVFIKKALGGVGVGVHDYGGLVDCPGTRAYGIGGKLREGGGCDCQREKQGAVISHVVNSLSKAGIVNGAVAAGK